jgi:hypothetical protein
MTKCLFVTLERHVLLIKNANLTDHFYQSSYGRCFVRIRAKNDISQDKDALPFYTEFQFPIIV